MAIRVTFDRSGPLGITLTEGEHTETGELFYHVGNVAHGSQAAAQGLKNGLQLLEVNEQSVLNRAYTDVVQSMSDRPVTMVFGHVDPHEDDELQELLAQSQAMHHSIVQRLAQSRALLDGTSVSQTAPTNAMVSGPPIHRELQPSSVSIDSSQLQSVCEQSSEWI